MSVLQLMKYLCVLLASVLVCACASRGMNASGVSVGSQKSVVVESLGSPDRSWRKDGKDFWYYNAHSKNSEEKMILVFENGALVEKLKPGEDDGFKELEAELQKLKNPNSDKFQTLSE